MTENPRPPGAPEAAPKSKGIPWRLIVFGVLTLYGVLLVILNADPTTINFVFWETETSLVVLLLVALGVGFLAGFLFDTMRDRRKRKSSSART